MKANRFLVICSILLSFLVGCKTLQLSQTISPAREVIVIPAERISESAIDEAHKNQLKIYAGIDLSDPAIPVFNQPLPEMKSFFRAGIRELVTKFSIDGLCLETADRSPDIVEDIVVEAMLVKPYLINALVYSGEMGYLLADGYLKTGIVDLIIPKTDVSVTDLQKISIPDIVKKTTPGQIFGFDLSALFPDNPGGQTVAINKGITKITDSEGHIGFIVSKPDTIILETEGKSIVLLTGSWSIPYKYAVMPDNRVVRKSPWLEFRYMPDLITDLPEYDFLCKTDYPASVRINGDSVKQYKTGIFFNKVVFNEGSNRVRATILTRDSLSAFYEAEFVYHKTDKSRKPFPLWINERNVEPASDIELLPEDVLPVSFQGSLGQEAFVEINPGKVRIKCSREDFNDYSLYSAEIPLRRLKEGRSCKITLKIIPTAGAADNKSLELALKHNIIVRGAEDFSYVKVARENSRLVYNLGAPRLGGPIRMELSTGVVMKTNGKIGENYRIRLSKTEDGFINQNDVQVMPAETVQPSFYITSMSCGPSKDADVLTIPYLEPVPYEVYPDPDQKRIVITLFGVESASTWITHLAGRRIIDKITWQQTTPETYQIYVNLTTPDIWGYSIRQDGRRLVLRLRYPPEYNLDNEKPLTGLKIAIEAGHGGSGLGAVGLSGLLEKDVNLDLSLRLGELLKSMGAEVVQARDSDKEMGLIEKRNIVEFSDADLFVSIHANAGGGGYLRTAGTSTYYHNSFWAPMAERIYDRMLNLGLKEFGVVGSFNYTPIRLSWMPSILVEQAFMSNAEDEEKLADPQFCQQEAQKIFEGIIDYLKFMIHQQN